MSETANDTAEGASLHAPAARLLRPLVRLFVARGITFPALTNLLRELYVNVAEYDFALQGKEQTDSRVSLLTGIHRKEVRRLRGAGAPVSAVPAAVSRTSRIIARWLADPAFTDRDGRPLALRRSGEEGPSFEALVAGVTRDLRPRAVLDEWLDRGLAVLDGEDRIRPGGSGLRAPRRRRAAALLFRAQPPRPHRGLGRQHPRRRAPLPRARGALRRTLRGSGAAAGGAREGDRDGGADPGHREAHAACATDPGGTHRWNFGLYVYAEAVPPVGAAPMAAPTAEA